MPPKDSNRSESRESGSEHPHTLVVWNPKSRTGTQKKGLRREIAATEGIRLLEAASPSDVLDSIKWWASRGLKRVVAAGGDGTVSAVATDILRSGFLHLAFAVLPLGTGNDLARSLRMPLIPEEAWPVCLSGVVHRIDLMRVSSGDEEHFAINMVTGGNTGRYTAVITDEEKQQWGPFCYLRGVVDVLSNLKVFPIEYRLDDGPWHSDSILNIFIANGRTSGGGLSVAPEASLTDGHFDVVLIRDGTAVDLASLAVNYAFAGFTQHAMVRHARAKVFELRSPHPFEISIDGDAIEGRTEWRVECLSDQLLAVFGPEQ